MQTAKECYFDHLIIGSGLSGLSMALSLAEKNAGSIAVITKSAIDDCNSKMAQGGIACVTEEGDTFEEHLADTLAAGAHLCVPEAVMGIVSKGPERIKWLINIGTHFTTREEMGKPAPKEGESNFDLGREGGHHKRRVLHAGDITGAEVERALVAACHANPNIHVFEYHVAIDLISTMRIGWIGENRCIGAYVLDTRENAIIAITALSTTLATGGCGKAYLYTSNPDVACGAGVAMGYRAFAKIANMEFYQFHPTILYHPKVKSFLISEALRGEGGVLKISRHDSEEPVEFMHDYHPMKSLAPRDVVARAIDNELKRSGQACAWLDMRHHTADFLQRRFPNIFAKCMEAGIDMSKQLIPVVPAAHFSCGGVKTDLNGYTGIPGLYAVGETACTGLHGANRLASNSLLEALVVPANASEHILACLDELKTGLSNRRPPLWKSGDATSSDEQVVITHNWAEIRQFMWDYVGIYRTNKRLERAKTRITTIRQEINKYYWDFHLTKDLIELRNLATVAELIIDSAMSRKESRGLHFNADYPERNPELDGVDTIIQNTMSSSIG